RVSEKSVFHVVNGKAPKELIESYREGEETGRESMRELAIEIIKQAFQNIHSPTEQKEGSNPSVTTCGMTSTKCDVAGGVKLNEMVSIEDTSVNSVPADTNTPLGCGNILSKEGNT